MKRDQAIAYRRDVIPSERQTSGKRARRAPANLQSSGKPAVRARGRGRPVRAPSLFVYVKQARAEGRVADSVNA